MNSARVLLPSLVALLVCSCAATSGPATAPAPETLRSFEAADAPRVDPRAFESSEALDASSGADAAGEPADSLGLSAFSLEAELAALPPQDAAPAPGKSRHSFSGGVGVRFQGSRSALNISAQYHYYVNDKLDIGGIVDWATSPIDTLLIAPAAWYHATDRLTVFAAPGIEWASRGGVEPALRLGGSYRLMLEKLALRPFGWYDFIKNRKDAFSIGIAIGI